MWTVSAPQKPRRRHTRQPERPPAATRHRTGRHARQPERPERPDHGCGRRWDEVGADALPRLRGLSLAQDAVERRPADRALAFGHLGALVVDDDVAPNWRFSLHFTQYA